MVVYTISQFAENIGVSTQTLRRWHKEGKLVPAFVTKSGRRMYTVLQIEEYLESCNASKMTVTELVGWAKPNKVKSE